MFRMGLAWVGGTVLAQAAPTGDTAITTLIGSGITGGTVLAYAWWRQRAADELLKQAIAAKDEMAKGMIDQVVPVLRDVVNAQNETRATQERVLEVLRREGYEHDRRNRDR